MKALNLFLKRAFDITVSLVGILFMIAIPILIIVPILIKLTSKGPVFFKQKRIGKNGKVFTMYKFRTMITEQYDKNGVEIMSENRITKIGKILRKTSLDELPQLFNVLNGSMSIIGPRPMLDYQAPRCIGEENLRFEMRPGLTGLAQVKGRNNIQWEERIQYDIEYVKTFTFWLDIVILFKTVFLVFKKQGTDVKPEYRGVSRFSKYYVPEEHAEAQSEAQPEAQPEAQEEVVGAAETQK
ncbi:MAG: sugar transferase [Clostridia bacterium]|nr:sugar transferase [Clostridia bacterium]